MEVKKTNRPKKTSKTKLKTPINGKGDSPRNLSTKFRSNYGKINWKKS